MATTTVEPIILHAIDDMLRLTSLVTSERDPIAALRDILLDMRNEVSE